MNWNIYAETRWNPRHLYLESIESEEAAKRIAERAVGDNPAVITRAWVEPAGQEHQTAFYDALRDMRSAREEEIADWFQDFCSQ